MSHRVPLYTAASVLALLCACESTPVTPDSSSPDQGGTPRTDGSGGDGAVVPDKPDLSKLVPWRAVDLVGPGEVNFWTEYDYRPRSEGGSKEDIDATLDHLKAIGVRQVEIQTLHAWSIEAGEIPGSGGIRSVVYWDQKYKVDNPATWGDVPRTRRGDMGIMAYEPPAFWDTPKMLATPLEINAKAEAVLGQMLDAVYNHGLIPVLKSEIYLAIATDAYDLSGDFNYTEPSRNFEQFYDQYQAHLVAMTRLAARHHAALMILGTETPYVAGAGQVKFLNGDRMDSRQPYIYDRWTRIIKAVRAAARAEGRPDLAFSYTEINPWWENRKSQLTMPESAPIWTRVPFWDDLDAVGINFYLPGRYYESPTVYDKTPKTMADMMAYEETHDFASDTVGNFADLKKFFVDQKGYNLQTKPVIFPEDGCTSTPYGAANPALPPALRPRAQPDFTEQASLYEAHFRLAEKYGGGWLAGFGFWQVTPTQKWGGPYNKANTDNYSQPAAYFNFLNNPAEQVVKTYFTKPF